jgi:hypothetical protein
MVNQYRDSRLEELDLHTITLQKSIEVVNREISEHIYEEDYRPDSPFVTAVWNSNRSKDELFKFQNKGPYEVEITMRLNPDLSFTVVNSPAQPAKPATTAQISRAKAKPKSKPKAPKQKQSAPITPIPRTPALSGRVSPRTSFDPSLTLIQMTGGYLELYNCFTRTSTKIGNIPILASQMSSTLILPN